MKAVVVAHGEVDPTDRVHLANADCVIAADGGALALDRWGIVPAAVIGDMDSLDEATLAKLGALGATVVRYPHAKDQTDLELALARAISDGASEIVVLGAFGGPRLDHGFANALLLAHPAYVGVSIRAIQGSTTASVLRGAGSRTLAGKQGDRVSLVPLGEVHGVRTEGLSYPLRNEVLHLGEPRGVSNEIASLPAIVSCETGTLLIIEVSLP